MAHGGPGALPGHWGGPETQASNLPLPLPWDLTCVVFPVVKDWGSPSVHALSPHPPSLGRGPPETLPLNFLNTKKLKYFNILFFFFFLGARVYTLGAGVALCFIYIYIMCIYIYYIFLVGFVFNSVIQGGRKPQSHRPLLQCWRLRRKGVCVFLCLRSQGDSVQVPLGKPLFLIPGAMAILGLPQGSGVRHCAKGSSCLQETWGIVAKGSSLGLGWESRGWGGTAWPGAGRCPTPSHGARSGAALGAGVLTGTHNRPPGPPRTAGSLGCFLPPF